MDVVIAGGHGKIALRLARLLADDGHQVCSLVRNPDHKPDVEATGAEPILCDLEIEIALAPFVDGAEAIVFAAGAGPGSGPERKRTVDLEGATKLIEAAQVTGARRYVIVSSIGAHAPDDGPEQMRPYLRAKAEADEALRESGLDYTIVRPGSLTDEPGTGRVDVSTALGRRGPIARDDVAAIIATCLETPETIGLTFEAFEGPTQIEDALRALGGD